MTQVHSRSAIPSIPTASPEARQRIAAALEATGLTPSTLRQAQGEREEIFLTENALLVLEKRYLLRDPDGKVIETPDQLFRRVARAIAEVDRLYEPKADPSADPSQAQGFGSGQAVAAVEEEFYQAMARLEFLPNSPTLMNAGTGAGTLSACFVLPLEDSMADIMKTASDIAMVQKFGGGTGVPLSSLRQKGAPISTTHGKACGPIAVLKHLSSVSTMITQGGKRDGANMAVMSIHHPDIEEFITCKHEEGTIHNYNISVGATEEFMKAVEKGGALELRSPGTGTVVKAVDARDVFQRIVAGAWRNGEPGMVFLDTMNRTQPTPHIGLIEATNPCGEQPLLPYESCNLGSINLATVLRDATEGAEVDWEKLRRLVWLAVHLAVHFLDNVIDANRYSVPEIERMTKLTRKIGLGVMGFADMLVRLGIPYDSEEGLEVGRAVMRFIQEEADAASRELAKARGPFPGFKGSRIEQRGEPPIRNACRLTVAPTGTISMIAGCSSGIEPIFALCFRKHNILEGQTLYYVDSAFEAVARAESFYTEELTGYLAEGRSFQKRTDAPQWARDVFVTAPDISPEY
ncbi:MAG: adenosylcobalamin-dependent ribonucleoside-diphosphate reductase, partial [Chloroflexi bacterium]|nr:adenosylcobalamin-dependent ribonucleoside-diphosphate reductase [Chloroflexota bacterium]